MNAEIPAVPDIAAGLRCLNMAQLHELANASLVPFTTLIKVRSGETVNPGIETVRKFLPLLAQMLPLATKEAA